MRPFELKMPKNKINNSPMGELTTLPRPLVGWLGDSPDTPHPLYSIDVLTLLGAFCPCTRNIKLAPMTALTYFEIFKIVKGAVNKVMFRVLIFQSRGQL